MKLLIKLINSLLLLVLFVNNIHVVSAQNYLAEYSCNEYEWAGTLYFNLNEWLYDVSFKPIVQIKINGDMMNEEREEISPDTETVKKIYYRSLVNNESIDLESISLFSKLAIKDILKQPEWKISFDSTQIIGDYPCYLAKGKVRGRNYTVWFTSKIPVKCGPWKLWGLPGLIIEAESDDGLYKWALTSLKPSDIRPKKPKIGTITPERYKNEAENAISKLSRQIRSLSGNDIEMSLNQFTITNPDKELFKQETHEF
jgi:GLPGLI family protein